MRRNYDISPTGFIEHNPGILTRLFTFPGTSVDLSVFSLFLRLFFAIADRTCLTSAFAEPAIHVQPECTRRLLGAYLRSQTHARAPKCVKIAMPNSEASDDSIQPAQKRPLIRSLCPRGG